MSLAHLSDILPWLTMIVVVLLATVLLRRSFRGHIEQMMETRKLEGEKERALTDAMEAKLAGAHRQMEALLEDLNVLRRENHSLKVRLEEGYRRTSLRYGIAVVGVSGSGKTALTLSWANPLFKLDHLRATEFAKYERTVSRVYDTDSRQPVEHIFDIYDWGGEYVEEVQTALVKLGDINALLIVVDLGSFDSESEKHEFQQERIDRQIKEFDENVLRFYFALSVVAHCKSFVLFINKADLLTGLPDEIRRRALDLYKPLVDSLKRHSERRGVSFEAMVGSAALGLGVQPLYASLIRQLLPPEAHDLQLSQEINENSLVEMSPPTALVSRHAAAMPRRTSPKKG